MAQVEHAPFCLDSLADYVEDGDDFWGDSLDARWHTAGDGSAAVVDGADGGVIRLASGPASGNSCTLTWKAIRSLHVNKKLIIEIKSKISNIVDQSSYNGVWYNSGSIIMVWVQPGQANYRVYSSKAGSVTNLDSGIAKDTNWHIFRIECHTHGGTHIHYYIDGVECNNSPVTTNIPDGVYLEPTISSYTAINTNYDADIDYIFWRQQR